MWHGMGLLEPASLELAIGQILNISLKNNAACTYDHRLRRIGHPVRSAIHKPQIGRLVVGWVTTSESLLLYVFLFYFFFWLFYLTNTLCIKTMVGENLTSFVINEVKQESLYFV